MSQPILLICSVELECQPLRARLEDVREAGVPGVAARSGTLAGSPVVVAAGGMGKVNAAHALALLVAATRPAGVIGFGVGGAYVGSGLGPGDVAIATSETYGDEGVLAPDGWMSCEGIGIPLHESGTERYFNRFPMDQGALPAIESAVRESGARVKNGNFVTVSCCSGTATRGAELAARFDAICESMEGAAYAHVATIHGLPCLEIRGISNLVEDRDLSRWRLAEAAEAAAAAVTAALPVWSPAPAHQLST